MKVMRRSPQRVICDEYEMNSIAYCRDAPLNVRRIILLSC